MNKNIFIYKGKEIEVSWDKRLCIHASECTRAHNDFFILKRKPWCELDRVTKEEAIEVLKRCPTGALSYKTDDRNDDETANVENTIIVSNNGPLYLRGNLEIEKTQEDMEAVKFRAALCRCGHSKNKPFCDLSHEEVSFKDTGAVGKQEIKATEKKDKLTVKTVKDGPYLISGSFTLLSSTGRVAVKGKDLSLCRCGHSKDKPFCDGTHKNKFKSD